jgi:hypothetical protein
MKQVVKVIITMMLLKYPVGMQSLPLWDKFGPDLPAGGFLDEGSHAVVVAVLDEDVRETLQRMSDDDPDVREMVGCILAMPDLTKE